MASRSKSTFQKRQKEMKRQEKQRMKAERRAQKKLASRTEGEAPNEQAVTTDNIFDDPDIVPADPWPQG
ncbi:MAG: hypothetical protein WBE20_06530 [Candidatus Acidiferrales bacterium]